MCLHFSEYYDTDEIETQTDDKPIMQNSRGVSAGESFVMRLFHIYFYFGLNVTCNFILQVRQLDLVM